MITECVAWQGRFTALYWPEVEEWAEAHGDLDRFTVDCGTVPDPLAPELMLAAESGGMFSDRTVIVNGAQQWEPDLLIAYLEACRALTVDVRVGVVYWYPPNSDDSLMLSSDWLTEGDVRRHTIPFEEGSGEVRGRWVRDWLGEQGVEITLRDAGAISLYCGEDVGSMVQALRQAVQSEYREVDFDLLRGWVPGPGGREPWLLTRAVAQGDRAAAAEAALRFRNGQELWALQTLIRQWRIWSAARDPRADLAPLFNMVPPPEPRHPGEGATEAKLKRWEKAHEKWRRDVRELPERVRRRTRPVREEARRLSADAAVRGLTALAEAERASKGGSRMEKQDILSNVVDVLTLQFQRPARSTQPRRRSR